MKKMKEEQEYKEHIEKSKKQVIHDINEYGFHMVLLDYEDYLPRYVYTIGLYKTYNHPEIIVFGLKKEVMQHLLHYIGKEIKKGTKFSTGKNYNGFLANYAISFIEVDIEYYGDYLGFAGWYYSNSFDFPAYQLIWPDKAGKYPWEEDFYVNWRFKQPILDRNTDFKYYEERSLGVYTTQATLDGEPILRVYHNKNGAWQFHSEEYPQIENSRIVPLEDLVERDPSLNEIHYLSYGEYAIRKDIYSGWKIYKDEEE